MVYLVLDKRFPNVNFWRTENLLLQLRNIFLTFMFPAIAAFLWTYLAFEGHFLVFPKKNLYIWIVVLLLYPVLAAYPQEIIFRAFFFQRYATLFSIPSILALVNGISFGWVHLVYGNWIAPILSTMGGILFAYRYMKSRSILIVGIEHGLWGDFLFTIGLGWYFYSGSIVH
jgi:membrane protease YdiL (CAAX protease family)